MGLIFILISFSYNFQGIVSGVGLVLSILGIIFGCIQKKKNQTTYGRIGIVMGCIAIAVYIIQIILVIYLIKTQLQNYPIQ